MSEQNEDEENHDIHDNKQEIDILMNHIKQLEEENNQLYENILKMGNKKQKKSVEYYVRLKKDLLTEESKLNQELIDLEKNKEKEKKELSFKLYNLKKKLNETLSENKTLKSLIESTNNELNKKTTTLSQRNVVLKNEINEKHIDELETKVNDLANKLREKESIIQEQKDKIDDLQMKIDNNFENMTAQINDIKLQYNNVYSASKKNEYNFNKLYEDKTNNLKDDIQSNKYQLEKKLVHSKNLISNINKEIVILNNIYESDSQIKDNEINHLKNNLDKVNNIYLEFSKLCGGDLEKLKNNIKQMKEIYLDRENEMETISKIYVETMNNYGEAIQENEKNKDVISSDFSENELLINRLNDKKKDLELILNKLKNIKLESVGDNISNINNKLSNMKENINHLNEEQNEFSNKIKKVNDFINFSIRNNNIIDSLQLDIKRNKKQNEELESKINKMDIKGEEEINELKNKLKKLEEEKISKDENIAKYEKMFENVIESVNNQDEVRTDVLKRLNEQISNYKSQIDKLLESKDNMQAYYIDLIKKMKEKITLITKENNELKKNNQSLQKESNNQKNKNNLCNQEYIQFKDAFNSISYLENRINEFNKSSEEIKTLRNYLLADEFLKVKEDIKLKNKEIKLIKDYITENIPNNNLNPNSNNISNSVSNSVSNRVSVNKTNSINSANALIKKKKNYDIGEIMKNIKLKVKIYNSLVNKKTKEVAGLENHIKFIKEYNNYSKKCGENQELLCEENKIMTDEIINDFNGFNQFEEELKNEIQFLEQKLKMNEESHSNNLLILNNNVNQQLNAIKDRENYIVKQSEQITDGLKRVATQKQNAVDVLKIENQQLKDRNYIINMKL